MENYEIFHLIYNRWILNVCKKCKYLKTQEYSMQCGTGAGSRRRNKIVKVRQLVGNPVHTNLVPKWIERIRRKFGSLAHCAHGAPGSASSVDNKWRSDGSGTFAMVVVDCGCGMQLPPDVLSASPVSVSCLQPNHHCFTSFRLSKWWTLWKMVPAHLRLQYLSLTKLPAS